MNIQAQVNIVLFAAQEWMVNNVKIIQNSNRIECKCGCIYEYDKNDIKVEIESELRSLITWERDYYEWRYVCCPICGRREYLGRKWYKKE